MSEMMIEWAWFAGKVAVVIGIVTGFVPVMVITERRVSGFIQGRHGPNRVGPFGLLQPIADVIKFLMKEDIVPTKADRFLFTLAPLIAFAPPLLGFAVLPFGNQIGDHKLQLVDLPVGILWLMAVLSVGVYGLTLGGWASNNKYSLLGALRGSAQLVSYELTLGLSLLFVIMMYGSIDPNVIVAKQAAHGWGIIGNGNILAIPCALVGFTLLCVAALAENNRLPFDMAECDAELVGGFHTEYSSFKFMLFPMAEYMSMALMSGLIVTLFLGGWHFPLLIDPASTSVLTGVLSVGVFLTKMAMLMFCYVWLRWTVPRFRYDQVMHLGWKILLPIGLANIAIFAVIDVLTAGA